MKIFKHSHFSPGAFGHGGNKRTLQIDEILARAGLNVTEADFGIATPTKNKPLTYLKGVCHSKSLNKNIKSNYSIGRYIGLFEAFVKAHKPDLFIWESTVEYHLPLSEVLNKYNVPVIALPHNLESLVSGSKSIFTAKKSPNWLFEEIKYLKYCKKVFTISNEESWLLANMGVNSTYLPYYPPKETEEFLSNIRTKKIAAKPLSTGPINILLLGTFYNKPTYDGYFDLIENLKGQKNLIIHIAGYGSQLLKDVFRAENILNYGEVTNETLSELIVKCQYAIVHQQPSSGALTRVPELLLAGIPVILNEHAARSTHTLKGTQVYSSYNELMSLLRSPVPNTPPILEHPIEENTFLQYVRSSIA